MLNNDRMAGRLARAMLVPALVLGCTPMLMLVADVPVAQSKPHGHSDSGSPDGCVPMGVTKYTDETVWAIEECNGQNYFTKMN